VSTVCLLILVVGTDPDAPLIVGANRDEQLDRPAVPMTVLRANGPRIIGGRDELAGGTWLAVNEAGVVAGLTNRPRTGGRDPAKRSRGELPLLLASHRSAADAVEAIGREARPSEFNPAWLLVGDRDGAFAVDMTGDDVAEVRALPTGIHILENRPLEAPSAKVDRVRSLLDGAAALPARELLPRLEVVLADHVVPAASTESIPENDAGVPVPPEVKAACVHTERYGTRWSGIVAVPGDPAAPPSVRYADGPPCRHAYQDASALWQAGDEHTPRS
jgi:uncharacterized protein with NRDE domain